MREQGKYEMVVWEPDEKTPGKRWNKCSIWLRKGVCVALCAVLFGSVSSVAFYGVNELLPEQTQAQSIAAETQPLMANTLSASDTGSQSLDVSTIAEQVMPSMVSITSVSVEEIRDYVGMFGRGKSLEQEVESSGTGIIIGENDTELLMVTNYHVVEDAQTLSVCFVDDQVCEAKIKGYDADNDLAVISVALTDIPDTTKTEIQVAQIGDSDSLKVGQQVVAIGNALGYGQSVTTGIVSAMNRQIDTSDAVMIQTDAAINPGNSGGALVNMSGQVIGINSAKFASTDVEGMGYAISMSAATPIIEELMNRATRDKVSDENASYLGITGEDVTSAMAEQYGIPQGLYITGVESGSPAEEAGLQEQYIITSFDGIKVTGMSSLKSCLEYYAAGETVEITAEPLYGDTDSEQTFSVTLGSAWSRQVSQQMPFENRDGFRS